MNTVLLAVAFCITNIKNVPSPKGGNREGGKTVALMHQNSTNWGREPSTGFLKNGETKRIDDTSHSSHPPSQICQVNTTQTILLCDHCVSDILGDNKSRKYTAPNMKTYDLVREKEPNHGKHSKKLMMDNNHLCDVH